MARPSKLNPEISAMICKALEGGATRPDAAEFAHVCSQTFYGWIAKGEKQKSGPFREFLDNVKHSEAKCRVMMANVIARAANDGDWRAAEAYLKRRDRANWGDQMQLEHSGDVSIHITDATDD
jgi:hypothetical protein